MGYTGANITGCDSPTIGQDRATFAGIFDNLAMKVDEHDHTTGKGLQIPTAGLANASVTAAKIAAAVAGAGLTGGAGSALAVAPDNTTIEIDSDLVRLKPSYNVQLAPLGIMLPYGGTAAPTGWLLCNGAAVSRVTYAALFAVIGTAFGSGDGSTTFRLPDTRGRFLRGVDSGVGLDPDRAARFASNTGGNTGDAVGTVQATATKLPTTPFVTGTDSVDHTHGINTGLNGGGTRTVVYRDDSLNDEDIGPSTGTTGVSTFHTHTVQTGGDNESRPPNIYVNYIIRALT
jgi:microcystin-dependent protein